MQHILDNDFIKALVIPFNEVLPTGALKALQHEFKVSETVPSKVLSGKWSNEDIAHAALRLVIEQDDLTSRFIKQFPKQVVDTIRFELQTS